MPVTNNGGGQRVAHTQGDADEGNEHNGGRGGRGGLGAVGAAWAVPVVSEVTMTQCENSRWVDIGYTLSGEEAIVTLSIETNGVAIPDSAVTLLSGDVSTVVQPGTRSIEWNAGVDWPEHITETAKARVTAWSVDAPPLYCAVDLTGGPSTNAYPVLYYTSADALPYGGLTNAIYKSSYLVMRKIPSGAFSMGEGTPVAVTLTKDFYAGVFGVTQGQWYNVMGGARVAYFTDAASRAYRPMENVSYYDIRENPDGNSSAISPNWPQTNAVGATSFMGQLQSKTGLAGFDLPTEAQWEYACRAGTTTVFNDGDASANVSGTNQNANAWLDALGRYKYNGGYLADGVTKAPAGCSPANGTAIVGSYAPNTWGLYDMHGNVWEWCLDWPQETLVSGSDPKGDSVPGSGREVRGGSLTYAAWLCSSAIRFVYVPSRRASDIGFRLVRTLP